MRLKLSRDPRVRRHWRRVIVAMAEAADHGNDQLYWPGIAAVTGLSDTASIIALNDMRLAGLVAIKLDAVTRHLLYSLTDEGRRLGREIRGTG